MNQSVNIDVKHVARVEGHGNIGVRLRDGQLTHVELAIVESPRFFESFMRGRHYSEAPQISCRICGICSIGHTTASFKAVEAALGITVSEHVIRLRKLAFFGEMIQSHVLHLYFLAVPDFLGVGSVIPLASSHPDVVKRALRMKRLANDLCAAVAGRHIHPIALRVGGLTHVPARDDLLELKVLLESSVADLDETLALFTQLQVPDLHRPTDYLALKCTHNGEYALYDGDLVSTLQPSPTPVRDYRARVIEEVVQHSAAKHCHSPASPTYAVGALARFNNNHAQLHPAAKAAAARLGLAPVCDNPFHNNTAQLVELFHCIHGAIDLINVLLKDPPPLEPLVQPDRFGRGVGAAEVPRGVLFHEYAVDARGRIEDVNLIIPTGQNLANIEADMRALVPEMLARNADKEQITLRLEMLVRAYDPCISCATHMLHIEWE